ncbi:MAG: P-loop NTPase [Elusimicrobiota bacterium]|jgi:ATP-binding protein involved in chromosome partitioning|nr:P-loop NTPase [Elusimicrobiota bacterium]
MNLDPKVSAVKNRLKQVKRIIAVSGFKGGVGKSSIACILALLLAKAGKKTGLMDLDFNGDSCAAILGVKQEFPEEIFGLTPPIISGVKLMTPAFFSQKKAINLRGAEITNVILELAAVTQWGELDFLILDMPPGFADAALDIIRFMPQAKVLLVKTPSVLSKTLVERAQSVLKTLNVSIMGEIENLSARGLPYDDTLEAAYGNPEKLKATPLALALEKQIPKLFNI